MKLSQSKDLTALRERAREAALRDFALATRSPLAQIYAVKIEAARAWKTSGEPSALLSQEAEIRGISVDELADLVIARAAQGDAVIADAEIARQRVLATIESATSERELLQIIGVPPSPSL